MRQEDQLKEKYGTDPGFRVPDGYFDDLNARIAASLPAYPEAPKATDMSVWQRIKPYVYMAAMFAGIWLMMQVFHNVTSSESLSLDNPPAAIAQALEFDQEEIYPYFTIANDYELEEEVSANYDSIEEFEQDFGYNLKPEFATIEVDDVSHNPASV